VLTNSSITIQVIGPLKPAEDFIEEDFNLLERLMMSSATGRIEKKIKALKLESSRYLVFLYLTMLSGRAVRGFNS